MTAYKLFEGTEDVMLPRFMIRSYEDQGHVYCALMQGLSHSIVKLELSDNSFGRVEVKEFY